MASDPYLILTCLLLIILVSWYLIDYIVLNKKTAIIRSKNAVSDGLLIFYLIGGILLLGYMCLDDFDENLNSIGVIVASQIAGIAIYKNIMHSEKVRDLESSNEEKKNIKILRSYYLHLKELAIKHREFLIGLEKSVIDNPDATLKQLKLNELYYSDEINNGVYIKPLENMLTPDLHKYTEEDEIVFILEMKEKVLNLMHNSKVARNIYIENNSRTHYLNFLKIMQNDNKEILDAVEEHLKKLT